jgi:hypothetical protein
MLKTSEVASDPVQARLIEALQRAREGHASGAGDSRAADNGQGSQHPALMDERDQYEVIDGFKPTYYELCELVRTHFRDTAEEVLWQFHTGDGGGGAEMARAVYRSDRITEIGGLIGREQVEQIKAEVEQKLERELGPAEWILFKTGTADQWQMWHAATIPE